MKIFEDSKNIVHIDNVEIFGFIIDEETCLKCDSKKIYYHDYDAKFCPICNEWLESQCFDPGCDYCKKRPERPLNT